MGDSVTASDIPQSFDMVAGYIDGFYRWSDADWALFPNKVKVRIAIHASTLDGDVLDVEWGAASPGDIPAWLTARRAVGADPSVYVNRGNLQAAKDACAAAGVAEPHWWLAAYGTEATVDAGLIAKQYANDDITGGHWDASVVADYWPGVDMGTAQELWDSGLADIVQEKVVAPQANTNKWFGDALAALSAHATGQITATDLATALEKVAVSIEKVAADTAIT